MFDERNNLGTYTEAECKVLMKLSTSTPEDNPTKWKDIGLEYQNYYYLGTKTYFNVLFCKTPNGQYRPGTVPFGESKMARHWGCTVLKGLYSVWIKTGGDNQIVARIRGTWYTDGRDSIGGFTVPVNFSNF